jgi:hypothetical protein
MTTLEWPEGKGRRHFTWGRGPRTAAGPEAASPTASAVAR